MAQKDPRPEGDDELLDGLLEEEDAAADARPDGAARGEHERASDERIPSSVRDRLAGRTSIVPPNEDIYERLLSGEDPQSLRASAAAAQPDAVEPDEELSPPAQAEQGLREEWIEPAQGGSWSDAVVGSTGPLSDVRTETDPASRRRRRAPHRESGVAEPATGPVASGDRPGQEPSEPQGEALQDEAAWAPDDPELPAPIPPGPGEDPDPRSGPVPAIALPPQDSAGDRPTALAQGLPSASADREDPAAPPAPWSRLSDPSDTHRDMPIAIPSREPMLMVHEDDDGRGGPPTWVFVVGGLVLLVVVLIVLYLTLWS